MRAATAELLATGQPRPARLLWWFIALSVLLHGWLLAELHLPDTTKQPDGFGPHLALTLQQRSAPENSPNAAQTTPKTPKVEPTQQSDTLPKPAKPTRQSSQAASEEKVEETGSVAKKKVAPAPVKPVDTAVKTGDKAFTAETSNTEHSGNTTLSNDAASSDTSDSGVNRDESTQRQRLRAHITLALQEHFSYPRLAQRRGWQGEVTLAFRVGSDGLIHEPRVVRSSGYAVLDRSAIRELGKVRRIQQPPTTGVTLQLPVIYRLYEG